MADINQDITRIGGNGRRATCVVYGGLAYVSGITTVALEGNVRQQAQDIFSQIDKLLAGAGTDKTRILRADIYLNSIADYPEFNAAWDRWVTDGHEPVRCVVEAKLPLVEYLVKVAVVAAV